MNGKAISVFEFETTLDKRLFGVMVIDESWYSELLGEMDGLSKKGVHYLSFDSSSVDSSRMQVMQFSRFSDAFKQGVNFAMGEGVFSDVKPDKFGFMFYENVRLCGSGVFFDSSSHYTGSGWELESARASIFDRELCHKAFVKIRSSVEKDDVEETGRAIELAKKLNPSGSRAGVVRSLVLSARPFVPSVRNSLQRGGFCSPAFFHEAK